MSIWPTDLPSFLWGAVVAGIAAFGSGLLKEAGKEAFVLLKQRFGKPEPVRLSARFQTVVYAPGDCAWVKELTCDDYADQGWTFYPASPRGAKGFRYSSTNNVQEREFLMVKKGAQMKSS